MKKVIFPKDWIQLQPYEVADMTDQYYTNIANQIYEIIMAAGYDKYFDTKDEVKHLALCIAAYFEDVISQTKIWETFTEECKRRYGRYIPFYTEENTEYYPDEVNEADIKFAIRNGLPLDRHRSIERCCTRMSWQNPTRLGS